jgi:glucose/arabinose dehydrogenase
MVFVVQLALGSRFLLRGGLTRHRLGQMVILTCILGCGGDVTQLVSEDHSAVASVPDVESAISVGEFALEASHWVVAPDFRIDLIASGFQLPVGIAMVQNPAAGPDAPLFYVAERLGSIKTVRRSGAVSDYVTGLLNFDRNSIFSGTSDPGVGGAVVDPVSGDLYVTLLYRDPPQSTDAPFYGAIDRLTSTDGGLTAASRTRILSLAPEALDPTQQISNISFGPDGYLYVHVGDNSNDSAAQDLTQFRGKILRMTREGAPVSRNPYWDPFNGISARDYVFASGLNNSLGGAWRISDNAHYFVERGPSVDRLAELAVGRNYLYDGTDASMVNSALFNWSPGTGPANITFVQQAVFERSGFPAEYEGYAYVTQSGSAFDVGPGDGELKAITEWVISERGELSEGARPIAFYNGDGASTAMALAAGLDGLYFSDLYAESPVSGVAERGANIFRLRYTAPPQPADCNRNGVGDADELSLGNDCNRNGVPDECDIAASGGADCNENGTPDECEVGRRQQFDFNFGVQGFSLNGAAQWSDSALKLTPVTGGIGSAVHAPFSAVPMDRLRAQFDFRIGNGSGADGISFAAFDSARYPQNELFGEDGPVPGALVVKLNTYDNGDGANNVQVAYNGQVLGVYEPSFLLRDHQTHTVRVLFENGRLTVLLSAAPGEVETAFERLEVLGYTPFVARFGFGARTGGFTDEHIIDNFGFWVPDDTDRDDSGVPDVCQCPADVDDGLSWGMSDGVVDTDDLLYFLHLYVQAESAADVDDGSGNGVRDSVVDLHDLDYFLRHFDGGC